MVITSFMLQKYFFEYSFVVDLTDSDYELFPNYNRSVKLRGQRGRCDAALSMVYSIRHISAVKIGSNVWAHCGHEQNEG